MFLKLNKSQINLFFITVMLILAITTTACANDVADAIAEPETAVLANTAPTDLPAPVVEEIAVVVEETAGEETAVQVAPVTTSALQTGSQLSADEIAGLMFMREEEKLAEDVYLTLYDMWGMNIFQNIASSEQTHTESVLELLNTYGLTDPAVNNARGEFTNQDLQALYDQLTVTGSLSLADALKVGAAIEEIDILDLNQRIATTTHDDISTLYQNLRAGSENHLRSFVSTLERQTGELYQPQYLDQATYDAIMTGAQSQGNGNGGNGNSGAGNSDSNGSNGNGNRGNGKGNQNGNNGQGNNQGQNG
ncbi:MAG: DUF2202 domain-containing protein [Anaerolineales bacterium]|nr:DUF2202 domain-containing protein [Anaerolineales bacterium]